MKILILDENNNIIEDELELMRLAKLDPAKGFKSIGLHINGQPTIFDKFGNSGYLDKNKYSMHIRPSNDIL